MKIIKAAAVYCVLLFTIWSTATTSELRFCLRSEPKTFNPLLVDDDASDTVRYLTGGVLVRINRQTQSLEPELAISWKISKDGRTIAFTLRDKVFFSDGSPFGAEDVAYTVERMMDPELHSPTGDSFRSAPGKTTVRVIDRTHVAITFPAMVAALDRLFDQVAIISVRSANKDKAVLGAYYVADYRVGAYVMLKRNPNYWKRDIAGRQLPYIDTLWLEIQANRDIEALRFKRGEIHLINSVDAEYYDRLTPATSGLHDAGPSLDSEQMWFNQVPGAPLPAYKLEWFKSQKFRRAISEAINRDDLVRVVFGAHAQPAIGPVSPANKIWFNTKLQPIRYDSTNALRMLSHDGFRKQNGMLLDRDGHAVEFSIVTNAGNKYRERMAAMIQQDLARVGIKVNVVTLDFPSLIERMTQSFNYEAVLLGLTNVEADPNSQMNVWLSSGDNHQWNPRQKSPATAWEAEIDQLMRTQASATTFKERKAAWDRIQEIASEQVPFIYLVNKNALSAVSPSISGASPVAFRPQSFWNIEHWAFRDSGRNGGK
jgi:peptide/nickel transport system substrate-binding protein